MSLKNPRTSFWASILTLPLLVLSAAPDSTPQTVLRIEDALETLVQVGPIAFAPDGVWVAYTVQDNRRRQNRTDNRYLEITPTGAPAYAVNCDIWITNTRTGDAKNLTQGKGTSWWPVWSPDGKHLAFYSDRSGMAHVWAWDIATGQMRQLSEAIVRPVNVFQLVRWTPDSRKIIGNVLPQEMTVEQVADLISGAAHNERDKQTDSIGPTVTVYSSLPTKPAQERTAPYNSKKAEKDSTLNGYASDLVLVDEDSGNVDRIVKNANMVVNYWMSPDGKYLAYTQKKKPSGAEYRQLSYELMLFNLKDKSAKSLVANFEDEYGTSVSWSPDSRSLAYITTNFDSPRHRGKGDCFVVSIPGGEIRNLTTGIHPPFGGDDRGPLWDSTGQNIYLISSEYYLDVDVDSRTDAIWKASISDHSLSIAATVPGRVILQVLGPSVGGRVWSPDGGKSLIVGTRDEGTKRVGFYRIDTSTGKAIQLVEENSNFGIHLTFDLSSDGQTIAYVKQDAQHPADIWVADPEFAKQRPVSNINPRLKGISFGSSRLVNWRSIDGVPLQGALLLPANYEPGKKYPLVVEVYGDDALSELVYSFGFGPGVYNLQLLATRGYAVLVPDAPLHKGTPMLDLLKTVMPGVDRVVDLGIADPERLGVMGLSYGGYSTLSLIVQTTRFKAAVDRAGPADLISGYGQMQKNGSGRSIGWSEAGQGRMGGTPWEFRDRYIENSPLFYLDRVQTPLLIVHGDLDTSVPYQQAEEVFVGLRRLGKEVVYAKYAGEGHGEYTWGLANAVDYWNRVIDWFDSHLKKPAQTAASGKR